MKTLDTIAGKMYVVMSPNGGTVTSADGLISETVESGKQKIIIGTGAQLQLDDVAGKIVATFNLAPAKLKLLGLLGGGSINALPAGYIAAEFVETQAAAYMSCNSGIATSSTGFKSEYMHTVLNGPGAEPFIATDGKSVWMIPPRPDGTLAYWGYNTIRNLPVQVGEWLKVEMNYLKDSKLTLNGEVRNLPDIGDITFGTLGLLYGKQKLKFLEITQGNKKSNKLIPAIDDSGQVCLYDEILKETLRNTKLIAGLTLDQAKQLSKLPATGGTLTISLPEGYEADEGVVSALEIARSNGWTLTIQTYTPETATASASTFAFRRIWVRRTQDDNGTYVDADGSRWMVEWCVDMLTPDGSTPDAHGYELYRSVDAAVAYWELEPWVDPEAEKMMQDELLTNDNTND